MRTTHLAFPPDTANIQGGRDVVQWISLHQQNVGIETFLQSPSIVEPEALRNNARSRAKRLNRRHADFINEEVQLLMHREPKRSALRGACGVAATTNTSDISHMRK